MKLRNKKTGEIGYLIVAKGSVHYAVTNDEWDNCGEYNSLAELNEEWEDYEEPHEPYRLTTFGEVVEFSEGCLSNKYKRMCVDIGNYFETEEEAKKGVEKLKVWKRLKDTGCKPIMWKWKQDYPNDACYVEVVLKCQFDSGVHDKDLDLLFGGKE